MSTWQSLNENNHESFEDGAATEGVANNNKYITNTANLCNLLIYINLHPDHLRTLHAIGFKESNQGNIKCLL